MESTSYFAVEVKRGETPHVVAGVVINAAIAAGLKFKELEVMGDLEIAGAKFVRFRADVYSIKEALDKVKDRGLIQLQGTTFQVALTNGRKGTLPLERMLVTPRMDQAVKYRGPGQPYAERQFES
jgi:hypothetical protein